MRRSDAADSLRACSSARSADARRAQGGVPHHCERRPCTERYRTPDETVAALINTARAGSPALLMRVLGPGSDEIVSSGDPVADAFARKRLIDAYNIRHQIVGRARTTLCWSLGKKNPAGAL